MKRVRKPVQTLMPAMTKNANRQPSTPYGRWLPMLVAKKPPAIPPAQQQGFDDIKCRLL